MQTTPECTHYSSGWPTPHPSTDETARPYPWIGVRCSQEVGWDLRRGSLAGRATVNAQRRRTSGCQRRVARRPTTLPWRWWSQAGRALRRRWRSGRSSAQRRVLRRCWTSGRREFGCWLRGRPAAWEHGSPREVRRQTRRVDAARSRRAPGCGCLPESAAYHDRQRERQAAR